MDPKESYDRVMRQMFGMKEPGFWPALLADCRGHRRGRAPLPLDHLRPPDWGVVLPIPLPTATSAEASDLRKPAVCRTFVRLRGKDSNLDYLIQSQASYH
jgi:hypothetical protein